MTQDSESVVVPRVEETFLDQLRRVNTERYQAWVGDGQDAGILFDAAELGGEVGELLNVVKKLEREERGWRGSRAAPEDFADECADVLICLDKLARRRGVDLAAATIAKFNATSDKVGLPQRLAATPSTSVVVPRVPTEAMLDAGAEIAFSPDEPIAEIWSAMLAVAPSTSVREEAWHPIAGASKDGTIIWALFRDDIFPALEPERSDLAMWNGLQVPLRHPGIYSHGGREWDHGWGVAAPVGQGGFPDRWIAGWRPLPAALVPSTDEGKRHG